MGWEATLVVYMRNDWFRQRMVNEDGKKKDSGSILKVNPIAYA